MGFDKPDEPIKTKAQHKKEAEEWKKKHPKRKDDSEKKVAPPTGLVDIKAREKIQAQQAKVKLAKQTPGGGSFTPAEQRALQKRLIEQGQAGMFGVSTTLQAASQRTKPRVKQFGEKLEQVIEDIKVHAEKQQKIEKQKAKELAGTGQFYVSPRLKAAQITHEDVEKLIEVTKQEWNKKSEKEKQKMMAMTGTGQFGVAPTLRDKKLPVVTSAKRMEKHLDDMKAYNIKITAYNKHIAEVSDQVDLLNDRGNKLPMDTIEKYNNKVEAINQMATELEANAGKVDLEDKGAVSAYNKKVRELNYKIAELEHDEYKVQQAFGKIDQFNRDAERINKSIEDNPAPIEPALPSGYRYVEKEVDGKKVKVMEGFTVGGTMVLAEEGMKVRWAEATAKELSVKQKAASVSGLLAEMFIPGVWARHWGSMSSTEKVINIALDIAILVPFIRLGGFALKAGLRALPQGVAKQMMKAEAKQIARTRAVIKGTYGEAMAQSFDNLAAKQLKYFEILTKLQKAKGAKAAKLEKAAQSSREELEAAARGFSKDIMEKGLLTEDPLVAEAFKRMPSDLVTHTQQAAEMAIKPKGKLKAAETDLAKAQASLDAAQAKFPTDPTKWQDLVADVMAKRGTRDALKGEEAVKLAKELAKARAQLAQADANLKRVAKGSDIYPSLAHARNLAQAKATALANRLRSAVISMEVLAGTPQGGFLGRMGVATPVKVRPPITRLGTGTGTGLRAGTKTSTVAIVAALAKAIPKDAAQVIVGDIDDPAIATYVRAKTMEAVDLARTLRASEEAMTDAELRARIKEQLKDMAKNAPRVDFKTALNTKAKAITRAALIVATATRVPAKVPPLRPKLRPPIPQRMSEKEKREYIEQAGGAVGLRMGELNGKDVWHIKVHPYTGQHFILVGKKPEGAKLVKGPGSGYKSAFHHKRLPKQPVMFKVGNQQVSLTPAGGSIKAAFSHSTAALTAPAARFDRGSLRITGRPMRITPKAARISR